MNAPIETPRLGERPALLRKVTLNHQRNAEQDHTALLDQTAARFSYAEERNRWWNPETQSLLWGTPLWHQSSQAQRMVLNHLYFVAYYSQIISAEIATIFFNQTSAAGLYGVEEFRPVCDMLDLESRQERAHIAAFRRVSDEVETELFGDRVFGYPMRGPYAHTMIFPDAGRLERAWRALELRTFGLLSSGNAFVACQYFLIRGLRTLCGKIAQHDLSRFCRALPEAERPVPSLVSHYHFLDESYHFNSSTLISHDILKLLPRPTAFERRIVNLGVRGCQRDHRWASALVGGIFWYDPAAFAKVYRVLRSPTFAMDHGEAVDMLRRCFTEDSEGIQRSLAIHREARRAYRRYVDGLDFLDRDNREMSIMDGTSLETWLTRNRRELGDGSRWEDA